MPNLAPTALSFTVLHRIDISGLSQFLFALLNHLCTPQNNSTLTLGAEDSNSFADPADYENGTCLFTASPRVFISTSIAFSMMASYIAVEDPGRTPR